MKLSLKQGESIRLAHDSAEGTFSLFVMCGSVQITAKGPGESTDIAIDDAAKNQMVTTAMFMGTVKS